MSYKIRRSKSKIKVSMGIETNQSQQHQNVVDILKSEIENMNLELRCKTYELEYIRSSREIENEIYSLIISVLLSGDDDDELSSKLVTLDQVINNLINELLDVFYTSKYSTRQQQYK